VSDTQVRQWFAKKTIPGNATLGAQHPAEPVDLAALKKATIIASIILAVLNLPISFTHDDEDFVVTMIGLGVLWIPFWFQNRANGGDSSDDSDDSDSGGDD